MTTASGRLALAALLTHVALAAAADPGGSGVDASGHEPWLDALLNSPQRLLDPARADTQWHISPAAAAAAADPAPEAQLLLDALREHLRIAAAGGWPAVQDSIDLRAGMRDPAVAILRRRLRASADYTSEVGADPWFFDAPLDGAVRRFQERHGLRATGTFDAATREAANISVEARIGQLAVTLERWRWLPRAPDSRHIWVNIGSLSLDIREAERSLKSMRVIVGHPDRPTPAMSGALDEVVFNPTWTVPHTIAVEDLLPRQLEDPAFLASRGFRVLSGSGDDEQVIDPAAVNWQRLGAGYFPYRLRQDAGPGNSLGRIKFGWDNPFDIYLHDTPAKGLFGLRQRTLSSGCVRLEEAAALATFLLQQDRDWNEADTASSMQGNTTRVIRLRQPLPIFIVYLTAWVDADGRAHFGRDLYGRDGAVLAALRRAAATAARSTP